MLIPRMIGINAAGYCRTQQLAFIIYSIIFPITYVTETFILLKKSVTPGDFRQLMHAKGIDT